MAKMKWGGYCPKHMSWNSRRLKNGLCTEWQFHLYNSWEKHGLRIHGFATDRPTYIGLYFAPCMYDFSNFVRVIQNDPLFPQFVQNHSLFDIDIDLYREFSPRSIRLMLKHDNQALMHQQNPHVAQGCINNGKKKARWVKVTTPLGNIFMIPSTQDCERILGVSHQLVSDCCRMKNGTHTVGYSGPYNKKPSRWSGWSFEYV